jgi:hypothetical protein
LLTSSGAASVLLAPRKHRERERLVIAGGPLAQTLARISAYRIYPGKIGALRGVLELRLACPEMAYVAALDRHTLALATRQCESPAEECRVIVALAGSALEGERESCLAGGHGRLPDQAVPR